MRCRDELGFTDDGGVWVKDETGTSAGSHKARHLLSILLHLLAAESLALRTVGATRDRPPLAIASCGNAALAAATLAAAVQWPIRVFVPPGGDPVGASHARPSWAPSRRRARACDADPPGDPCIHRFREAVDRGRGPVQRAGPENAWCLDGGRTIGWEMAPSSETSRPPLDRVFVQVGGGALAACVDRRVADAPASRRGCTPCRPTAARRWQRAWKQCAASSAVRHGGGALARVHVAVGARRHVGGRRHPRRRDLRLARRS